MDFFVLFLMNFMVWVSVSTQVEDSERVTRDRIMYQQWERQELKCNVDYDRCRDHQLFENCWVRYQDCSVAAYRFWCGVVSNPPESCSK